MHAHIRLELITYYRQNKITPQEYVVKLNYLMDATQDFLCTIFTKKTRVCRMNGIGLLNSCLKQVNKKFQSGITQNPNTHFN